WPCSLSGRFEKRCFSVASIAAMVSGKAGAPRLHREARADIFELRPTLQQGVYATRIEQAATLVAQVGQRRLDLPRRLVRPRGHQCIEDVRDGHDACLQWNILANQAVRVAASVVALVVAKGDHR